MMRGHGTNEVEARLIALIAEREAAVRAEILRAASLPMPVNCRCLANMAKRHSLSAELVPQDPAQPSCPCLLTSNENGRKST